MNSSINGLAARAFSQLTPDVFAHPVWVDFVRWRRTYSIEMVEKLQAAAKDRKNAGDVENCCQILFLCAFLYHSACEEEAALGCLEKIRELAEVHSLALAARRAVWATGALYYQQGQQRLVGEQLSWLRDDFMAAGDWVLADTLELIRLGLKSQGKNISFAYEWLRHWGEVPSNDFSTSQAANLEPLQSNPNRQILAVYRSIADIFGNLSLARKLPSPVTRLLAWFRKQEKFIGEWLPESGASRREQSVFSEQDEEASHLAEMAPAIDVPNYTPEGCDDPGPVVIAMDAGNDQPPILSIYCLGPFRVFQDDSLIPSWPGGKSKAVFKYMVTHRSHPTPKEVLMEMFWPEAEPNASRNNLNVAIYKLRQALRSTRPDFPHILFEEDSYLLNPEMPIWVDFEEFLERYANAQKLEKQGLFEEMVRELEAAESLYQDDFMVEDLYEEWMIPNREGLKDIYLIILDRMSRHHLEQGNHATCAHLCKQMLAKDACREDAHRRLMVCFSRQGQPYLALRQYHLCVEALAEGLEMAPMADTEALYLRIRRRETV